MSDLEKPNESTEVETETLVEAESAQTENLNVETVSEKDSEVENKEETADEKQNTAASEDVQSEEIVVKEAVEESNQQTEALADDSSDNIESNDAKANEAEKASQEKPNKPLNKKLIAVIAAILVVIAGVGSYAAYDSAQKQAALEAQQSEIDAFNQYIDNLDQTMSDMLQGMALAEDNRNDVVQVWHSAIFEEDVNNWDAEYREFYATDFNDALAKLMFSKDFLTQSSKIEANQEMVKEEMSALVNPPKELETAYDTLTEMYGVYTSFTNAATDPSGSLTSYSSTTSTQDDKYLELQNTLETQIPSKKDNVIEK